MPFANFSGVYCCSSEDKAHPAANLILSANINKKWKCAENGLKSIYVILQFEKPTKITGIDIGNEHAAFIQVYVGRNGWNHEDYKEILLSSSFMTPLESRDSTVPNRVRCFKADVLLKPACDEKWDFLKMLCTQPFNKHVQYGISFIKVHCAAEMKEISVKEKTKCETLLDLPANNVFAQFKLRDESSSDSDNTSLFSKWKQDNSPEKNQSSAAAAIRDASLNDENLKKLTSVGCHKAATLARPKAKATTEEDSSKKISKNRNHYTLIYDDDDENTSIPKLEKIIDKDRERIRREQEELQKSKKKPEKKTESTTPTQNRDKNNKMEASSSKFRSFLDIDENPNNDKNENNNQKPIRTPEIKRQPEIKTSGETSTPQAMKRLSTSIDDAERQTPKRKKSMSPKIKTIQYKPFGKLLEGIVLVISGIQNPHRADLRSKALKMGAKYKPDWDSSCTHLICAFSNTPKYNQVKGQGKIIKKNWIDECFSNKKRLPWRRFALDKNEWSKDESEDEIHDLDSKTSESSSSHAKDNEDDDDLEEMYDLKPKPPINIESGSDSEDEIIRPSNNFKRDSIWDADTEEETI